MFHSSARDGFGANAIAEYERGRPEHSQDFVVELLAAIGVWDMSCTTDGSFPLDPVLELGCGTGKYTRALYNALLSKCIGSAKPHIVCSDPADMAAKLVDDFPDIPFLRTTADKLEEIPDGSVCGVLAAQCFHWFADTKSVDEIVRVMKRGASLALIWNMRDEGTIEPWTKHLEDLIFEYYEPTTPKQRSGEWRKALEDRPDLGPINTMRRRAADYEGDEATVLAYMMSISDISKRSAHEKAVIADRFREVLYDPSVPVHRQERDGSRVWRIPMVTEMHWVVKQ